ncbi:MAG: M16 family metallopeptidase [Christensenellales bacterium]
MVENFKLSNGLRVIMERLPHLRSVSIGVWVKAGSILELPEENGLSHLMEHMAFKQTQTRSARELAEEMDAIGGHMNAATSKLTTSYYAKVTDQDLEKAVELLADITTHSLIEAGELEKEKNVVIEEIAMVEDSPEDLAYDLIYEAMYKDQSLAMPITGTRERIAGYTRDSLLRFREKYYGPRNTVISVVGQVHREALQDMLERHFGRWRGEGEGRYPHQQTNLVPLRLSREKKTEQTQICLGYSGIPEGDKDRHAVKVFSAILGGGVSSRLFQRVREEQGLVYSIYAAHTTYPDCGEFMIYAATSPKNAQKVMGEIDRECRRLLSQGITQKELLQAKAQIRTGMVLASESAYVRMSVLASNLLLLDRIEPLSVALRGTQAVTEGRVLKLAQRILNGPMSLAIVGPRAAQHLK